ncbi:MAG: TnpV protein [Bacilli bacterium]|nr:TnpV protein [Bacilli bacterium]
MMIMKKAEMLKGAIIMNMTYTQVGNYLLPNLVTIEEEQFKMGKYGTMRLQYLKENKKGTYEAMLMKGTLQTHLKEIETSAQTRVSTIMDEMKKKLNITEELKSVNQMKWLGMMNNIKNQAEEIMMRELIFN